MPDEYKLNSSAVTACSTNKSAPLRRLISRNFEKLDSNNFHLHQRDSGQVIRNEGEASGAGGWLKVQRGEGRRGHELGHA